MSGTFNSRGELEPSAAALIGCFGRKGSGKSVMGLTFARGWPYDMVVIDVAGDDGPVARQPGSDGTHDVFDVHGTVEDLPRKWPEHLRYEKRPMILHYCPDAGSPTALEDMDVMTGLAYAHSDNPRPCMLVVHEIGVVAPAGQTPAHMKRVLNHSRHRALTAVFCGPRPQTVDPLVLSQLDLCYVFELPNPSDRRRVAESIGWNPKEFDLAVDELGPHEYLRHDAREPKPQGDEEDYRLTAWPKLPDDVKDDVTHWARGDQRQAE